MNNLMNLHLLYVTGGLERVCIINDEECLVRGKVRSSGDLVKQTVAGLLYFVGRQDDIIKRHGKRINLYEIEQVGNSLSEFTFYGIFL